MGLKTEAERLITRKRVNPIGIMQCKRDNFYLYGLVEPLTGENFIWKRLEQLNTSIVASVTGWDFILDALFVSGFS